MNLASSATSLFFVKFACDNYNQIMNGFPFVRLSGVIEKDLKNGKYKNFYD